MTISHARLRQWTDDEREEIVRQIEFLRPWMYSFDFGGGLSTRQGQNPLGKFEKILNFLPSDLKGASCLDLPCANGQLSMLLKERNAGRCVARDISEKDIAQASFITQLMGHDIDLAVRRVEDIHKDPAVDGGFDYVFCLGLIYHLTDMFGALKQLAALANIDCFLETAVLNIDNYDPDTALFIEGRFASDSTNWWIPGVRCVIAMGRAAGFNTVELIDYFEPREKVTREGARNAARGIFRATKGKPLLAPRKIVTA